MPSSSLGSGVPSYSEGRDGKKRTARACDSCYKRKIKCDAVLPRCNWCSHHNIPCTFERSVRGRRKENDNDGSNKTAQDQRTSALVERLLRIEKILTENFGTRQGSQLGSSAPLEPLTASSSALNFAGREFGVVSLITGIPFFLPEGQQWVQSRTGQSTAFANLSAVQFPWGKQRSLGVNMLLQEMKAPDPFELPDKSLVTDYFRLYSSSQMRVIFPVVDRVLFAQTIETAYSSGLERPGLRASIFAFLAFASVVCDEDPCLKDLYPQRPALDSEPYAIKAQWLVPFILQEGTTLDGLQTFVMLTFFELVSGHMNPAHHYGGLAGRFLFSLNAHTTSHTSSMLGTVLPDDMTTRTQRHLRNVFWLFYTLDKDLALRTGLPQILSDENCDLTMPSGYVEKLYTSMRYPHLTPELPEDPLFPIDLRLSIIKSRAYSALYSFRAMQKSDAEILKAIRELDDELERWRLSIPMAWRPTMSWSPETGADPYMSMHSVKLRLNYHLCMTVIHLSSRRCQGGAGTGLIGQGISSSLALSVEASRSTLFYLNAAEHILTDGFFWVLLFYPMSALLTIFCHTLQNPLDPHALGDLDLLQTVGAMLQRVFMRDLSSTNEIVHIKLIADFVGELHRLAKSAIDKARTERYDTMV
ncbi:hypothetical protein ASPZODRAFT_135352 [Penicilliopsis zonata CBS 506.65]|uniref:Zn(2)-C6 fungal-type domain-containing protein n=1 Tax=Penicilliopsis zonata CBS 506.65 TaxID=1073090 RepID=A0A1L9S9U4_9EURO|nr:hypothetical protein ASPZODRAFT_135352 [Penicilliopsis zonata CBS 506.65]OJJ43950.1 hypothetical protein ASPZODRAFT_135352 [Penicilliopsis zonata CBS 506.65]